MAKLRVLLSWVVAIGVFGSAVGCSSVATQTEMTTDELPFVLSGQECRHLLEIDTTSIQIGSIEGPSEAQMAIDAAQPSSANLANYTVVLDITQSFENLLDRRMTIEEITATLSEPGAPAGYDVHYDMDGPIELLPHERKSLTFNLRVPGDQMSNGYLLSLVEGAALGMSIAPVVRIDIPESDNCGYPEGIVVRAAQGTVKVYRPVESSIASEIFGAILKSL